MVIIMLYSARDGLAGMPYIDVSPNIIVFHNNYNISNPHDCSARTALVTCIALPDGLIFVDTGAFTENIAKFRKDMEIKFKKSTLYLFLTHAHWDHIFAMGAFLDVDVVASSKSNTNIRRRLKSLKDPEYLNRCAERYRATDPELAETLHEVKLKTPTFLIKDTFKISSEDKEITFNVVGGHTEGSSYVHVVDENILCAGDNLVTCYAQIIGNASQMLYIYRKWETLNLTKIIPGHGPVVDTNYLIHVKNYFETLFSEIETLKRKLLSFNEVLKSPQIPDYFMVGSALWIEGGKYYTKQLERTIKQVYKSV